MKTEITLLREGKESALLCDSYILVVWNEEEGERSAAVVHCGNPSLPEPHLEVAGEAIAKALANSTYNRAQVLGTLLLNTYQSGMKNLEDLIKSTAEE